ncbi:hypothetical protein Csa_014715, partial [Cucumis sativus]
MAKSEGETELHSSDVEVENVMKKKGEGMAGRGHLFICPKSLIKFVGNLLSCDLEQESIVT